MMRIYDFVTQQCNEAGIGADTATVQRIVGTLVSAGFSYELGSQDEASSKEVILDIIKKRDRIRVGRVMVNDKGQVNPGNTGVVNSVDSNDRFLEIDAYIEKGQCPRCKISMTKVKLGSLVAGSRDFMMANYCKNCKTTLWVK